jgi:hypothetical protein
MTILLIQFILLLLIFFSLLKKKPILFVLAVTFQILIYDVLSVFSDEQIPVWIRWPMKGWQELIFVYSGIYFLRKGLKLPTTTWIFFFLGLMGLLMGFIHGSPPEQIIQGFRLYLILPFSLFLLLESGIFNKLPIFHAAILLIGFCCLSVVYSLWLDTQFKGELCFLWFYDFVDKIHPIEAARFNYIRNEGLRATGFFISPLIQSAILGFVSLISLSFVLEKKGTLVTRLPYLLIAILLVGGLYLCRTRIGWIILSGGFIQWLSLQFFNRNRFYNPFYLPAFFVILTFTWLLSGFSSDPSANGRLDQYAFCFENFKFLGYGFGHVFTITLFDSLIISSALLFGIFSIFYLMIPIGVCYFISQIPLNRTNYKNYMDTNFLYKPIFGFSFFILYMMAFQFTTGGPTIQLFYWFSFLILNDNHKKIEKK